MFKWIVGGLVLGGGIMVADILYMNVISPRLPMGWDLSTVSATNQKPLYGRYASLGLGAVALVPLVMKLVGLSAQSPIKPEAAPIKV